MVLNPPGKDAGADDPPYSRLFVVYNRKDPVTEAEIREDFSQYGNVQDIFIVKDRSNGEPKGESAYIYDIHHFIVQSFALSVLFF